MYIFKKKNDFFSFIIIRDLIDPFRVVEFSNIYFCNHFNFIEII